MGPVAFSLASADGSPVAVSAHAWAACAIFASYYVGTVPLVRSMIRGRRDPRWSLGATAYHAACTAATAIAWWFAVISPWCVLAWVALTARAWAMPALSRARKRPLSPRLIGLTEMAWTCLLFTTLLLP